MNRIIDFANKELNRSFRFDGCKKLTDDWNGASVYAVTSKSAEKLCIGLPTFISETNGKLAEVKNPEEIFNILKNIKYL